MKAELIDLKNAGLASLLTKYLQGLTANNYYVFFYKFNEAKGEISDIKNERLVDRIDLTLYKNNPHDENGHYYNLGYFQLPFDTQNFLFYAYLKFYCKTDDDSELLAKFYADSKKADLENVEYKLRKSVHNNIFKIYTRDEFSVALDRFCLARREVKDAVMGIFDSLDGYLLNKQKKSLYGGYIESVLMAIRNPNGGLIPDFGSYLRYFYVGESSKIFSIDNIEQQNLSVAKEMLRNGFNVNETFIKTGWYFNTQDYKWRKRIDNSDCKIANIKNEQIFIKPDSKFNNLSLKEREMLIYTIKLGIKSGKSDTINDLLSRGWDTNLNDVLSHPTLYKHYPSFFSIPTFFIKHEGRVQSFYFSSEEPKHILLFGDEKYFDFKTILLHETQHAIQELEQFGKGGNSHFAAIIYAMGKDGFRKFMFLIQEFTKAYMKEAVPNGKYSYEKYMMAINKINGKYTDVLIQYSSSKEYYADLLGCIIGIRTYMVYSKMTNDNHNYPILKSYLGEIQFNAIEEYAKISKEGASAESILKAKGYDAGQISRILFDKYANLSGEFESRDVERSIALDSDLIDYIEPLTSESVNRNEITSYSKGQNYEDLKGQNIYGAIEKTTDDRYAIHLFPNYKSEPILHELAHIISDIIGKEIVESSIISTYSEREISMFKNIDEMFCEIFLSYLVKKEVSEDLTIDIEKDRKFVKNSNFDHALEGVLDDIFFTKRNEGENNRYEQIKIYLNKLTATLSEKV